VWARPRGGRRRRREGRPGIAIGSTGRPTTSPDRQVRATSSPREQRWAAGVGDTVTRAKVADVRDQGEAGLGGSGQGAREKERE
jgi:hypothetical protein